jgi:hypothetical protein
MDLNAPGQYLTWWIFTISVANLAVIVVMPALFAVALVLAFPAAPPPAGPRPGPARTPALGAPRRGPAACARRGALAPAGPAAARDPARLRRLLDHICKE